MWYILFGSKNTRFCNVIFSLFSYIFYNVVDPDADPGPEFQVNPDPDTNPDPGF
jgi:hypothetical protein